MYVQLEMENGTVAEVYSNPAPELGSRLFAMFFWPETGREQEVYAASVEVAVASCFEPPVE